MCGDVASRPGCEDPVKADSEAIALMPTDDEVRAFMVEVGLRDPGNISAVTPPEVRYFQKYKPSHDARKVLEEAKRKEWEERWARVAKSSERADYHARHMKKCREWGNENGFTVGTRGAIPKAVRQAYKEATGVEL
ncbi:histone-like nucleoid-structuring protein Lsr2 [Kitasatospora sp. NPDC088556]|uniref:Lsr2 family DNA-binding protein n=1 Tax=Kitasatospora sp. NPDC088556 TaxID=3364076 RepID=UPI003821F897